MGGSSAAESYAVVGRDSKGEGKGREPGRGELMGKLVREFGVPLNVRGDGEG